MATEALSGHVISATAFALVAALVSGSNTMIITFYTALRDALADYLQFQQIHARVCTVQEAKGNETSDVILLALRRHADEWKAEGILNDPGRIAIGLSRASRNLTLIMDYWVASTSRLQHVDAPWQVLCNAEDNTVPRLAQCRDAFAAWVRSGRSQSIHHAQNERAEDALGKARGMQTALCSVHRHETYMNISVS